MEACLALTSYGFPAAQTRFEQAGVALHVLAPFPVLFGTRARHAHDGGTGVG
ncbi:MAG: hypothetical protein HND48_11215 [Chloroflexi bacterium]|nr:hypothetical protein [Chloroflexota bacterium]